MNDANRRDESSFPGASLRIDSTHFFGMQGEAAFLSR